MNQDSTILPAWDYVLCPERKNSLKIIFLVFFILYNKSFIDQACLVKMAGYWPRSFLCVIMDLDSILVHKHAKKELGLDLMLGQ